MGLTYAEAVTQAKHGKKIKRADWYAWLEWYDNALRFVLPKNLAKRLGTDYTETEIDIAACDWAAR